MNWWRRWLNSIGGVWRLFIGWRRSLRVLNLMRRDLIALYPIKKGGSVITETIRWHEPFRQTRLNSGLWQRIDASASMGENQRAAVFSQWGTICHKSSQNIMWHAPGRRHYVCSHQNMDKLSLFQHKDKNKKKMSFLFLFLEDGALRCKKEASTWPSMMIPLFPYHECCVY